MTRAPALTRSEQMARIRGRNTLPEVTLRHALWKAGLRYRLDARTPVGRPDLTIVSHRLAVFVDGCFWHGCPEHGRRAHSVNGWYWPDKIARNRRRDEETAELLSGAGWLVVRVWEHEVTGPAVRLAAERVRDTLAGRLSSVRPAGRSPR